jgi:hypothetical protein
MLVKNLVPLDSICFIGGRRIAGRGNCKLWAFETRLISPLYVK